MSQKFNPENPFKKPKSPSEKPLGRSGGLRLERFFSADGVHPFDQIEWEKRAAKISSDTGEAIFEQDNIEVPIFFSQLATKVVASKYFFGDVETGERESSVKQLLHRVCRMIADRGLKDGYFETDTDAEIFYSELLWLCVNQYGAFNSPVWFNAGLYDSYDVKGSKHNYHWDARHKRAVTCTSSYEYPQHAQGEKNDGKKYQRPSAYTLVKGGIRHAVCYADVEIKVAGASMSKTGGGIHPIRVWT